MMTRGKSIDCKLITQSDFHCGQPRSDSPGLQATHSPCCFSAASQAVELVNQWQELGVARQHLSFVPPSQPDRTDGSPPSLMKNCPWFVLTQKGS